MPSMWTTWGVRESSADVTWGRCSGFRWRVLWKAHLCHCFSKLNPDSRNRKCFPCIYLLKSLLLGYLILLCIYWDWVRQMYWFSIMEKLNVIFNLSWCVARVYRCISSYNGGNEWLGKCRNTLFNLNRQRANRSRALSSWCCPQLRIYTELCGPFQRSRLSWVSQPNRFSPDPPKLLILGTLLLCWRPFIMPGLVMAGSRLPQIPPMCGDYPEANCSTIKSHTLSWRGLQAHYFQNYRFKISK